MAAIKEGGVTQNESLLPQFSHKKSYGGFRFFRTVSQLFG